MLTGRVSFVGAGPGAADLITVRGARRIAEADVVVWAPSAVDTRCVREHARPDAELIDFSRVPHEDVLEAYRRAAASRLKVVRIHVGDPSLWGSVQEQYDSCQRLGLDVEIVPGVSHFSAAAAVAGKELTVSEVAQSVILAAPDSSEHVREFARHGTTMAVFLSAARASQFVEKLRAGGYAEDTPVVVAYKVSLPDELIAHTTVAELEAVVRERKLYRPALFLVGEALRAASRSRPMFDEPVRRARPTRWSRRASTRLAARGEDSASAAVWSAVEDLQESARRGPVRDTPAEETPKPRLAVVAAATRTPQVQVSTAAKKKTTARKTKRTS